MSKLLFLAIISVGLYLVHAECPNGCSGRGTCSARDMCVCHKNYQGNDCSLRTCPFGRAHADTNKGDLNMDASITNAWQTNKFQAYPGGVYEGTNPSTVAEEAHYYMECSNRGICDREEGLCTCFDGYEGSACQRQACPNACSGHGTCESISEFATDVTTGTLFGKKTNFGATTYTLWDRKVSYGCRCDPWFFGPDCSQRRCRVGIDPMYEAGSTEQYPTFIFRIAVDAGATAMTTGTWVRYKFWDFWGEQYITDRITLDGTTDATSATNIAAAFTALPNGIVPSIVCENDGALSALDFIPAWFSNTDYSSATNDYNMIACQFTGNPGKLRVPEVFESYLEADAAVATGTTINTVGVSPSRGEEVDWCGILDAATVTDASATSITYTGTTGVHATDDILIRVMDQYYVSTAASGGTITIAFDWGRTALASTTKSLFRSSTTVAVSTADTGTTAPGATSWTLVNAVDFAASSWIFTENEFYYVLSVSGQVITVDHAFGGLVTGTVAAAPAANGAIFKVTEPTADTFTYVSECSGRGLCDREMGTCDCFKGFTNDNCDTQNIMAF